MIMSRGEGQRTSKQWERPLMTISDNKFEEQTLLKAFN